MLLLLALAVPLAVFGLTYGDDDDDLPDEPTIEGTDEADRLEGTQAIDFIDGLDGDDVMNGAAGNDFILGRGGDDVLQGEDGDDTLCAGDGNDIVTGNVGQDFIEGQGGDDGNDTVLGGRGIDEVNGGEGDDLVFGGIIDGVPLNLEELAELRDGGSLEAINGGLDMRDDSVGNVLSGGDGDDDLVLGSGDMADGNNGADTYHIMSEQNGDAAAMINNYVPADDAITIIVDDIETDEEIFVDDEDGDAVIRLGDDVLARVSGAAGTISAADITLIDQGQVEALFDPNPVAEVPAETADPVVADDPVVTTDPVTADPAVVVDPAAPVT